MHYFGGIFGFPSPKSLGDLSTDAFPRTSHQTVRDVEKGVRNGIHREVDWQEDIGNILGNVIYPFIQRHLKHSVKLFNYFGLLPPIPLGLNIGQSVLMSDVGPWTSTVDFTLPQNSPTRELDTLDWDWDPSTQSWLKILGGRVQVTF